MHVVFRLKSSTSSRSPFPTTSGKEFAKIQSRLQAHPDAVVSRLSRMALPVSRLERMMAEKSKSLPTPLYKVDKRSKQCPPFSMLKNSGDTVCLVVLGADPDNMEHCAREDQGSSLIYPYLKKISSSTIVHRGAATGIPWSRVQIPGSETRRNSF